MKEKSINILGYVISVSLIIFSVFYFDWDQVIKVITGVNPWFFPFLFLVYFIDFMLRAYRWKLLLYPIKKNPSFSKLFYSYNLSSFANVFLPARLGEFFRIYVTGQEEKIYKRTILGTLFLERILDVLGIGVLIVFTILFTKISTAENDILSTLRFWALIFISVFFISLLFVILIKRFAFLKNKVGKLEKITEMLEPIYQGFSSVEQISLLCYLVVLSIFMWMLNATILYLYMIALSFETGFTDSVIVLTFQLLGEFIPSAPSSIGTFHASTVIGATFVDLTKDQGLVLAIFNHFYEIIVKVVFGIIAIQALNFNFKKELKKFKMSHTLNTK